MARKPLALGETGNVSVRVNPAGSGFIASCRYRRNNGVVVQRKGRGKSMGAARRDLSTRIEAEEKRGGGTPGARMILPTTKLRQVVAVWCVQAAAETKLGRRGSLRKQTLSEYVRLLNREVVDRAAHDKELEGLGDRRLNELSPQVLEEFLAGLDARHAAQPRNVRAALAGPLDMAVRYQALDVSPLKTVKAFQKAEPGDNYSLTAEQVPRFRAHVALFGHEPGKPGPRVGRQLVELVEVGLDLAIRPGELLALHWEDFKGLGTTKPTVNIQHTVVFDTDDGTHAQPRTKDTSSMRVLVVPARAAEVLRSRKTLSTGPLVFPNRKGGVLALAQYQKWMRAAVKGSEFLRVTPHTLRRTTATLLLAADPTSLFEVSRMLGHSSVAITEKAYISKALTRPDLSAPVDSLYA